MIARRTHQLTPETLADGLRTRRVARRIICLPEVDSTNTYALQTLAATEGPAADGTVVFAEHQTAGRGRLGRAWHAPAGASLLMTILLWEAPDSRSPAYWMMAAAVSVVRGIEQTTDLDPQIRWPNDVYLSGRKVAGILVEVRRPGLGRAAPSATASNTNGSAFVAIGIGVNCLQHAGHFPAELRQQATSLEMASSHPVDRVAVARALLQALDDVLNDRAHGHVARLRTAWTAHSGDIGTSTTLLCDGRQFRGRIADVHPEHGLLLQLETGARRHFDPATTSRL